MKPNPKVNLLTVRHVIKEFFGKGNLDHYENFVAEDVVVHCPPSWQEIHSSEIENDFNTKIIDQEYAGAFKFTTMMIGDTITSTNKVSVRWGGEGIHTGDFFSIPASHRPFTLSGQTQYQLNQEGKIQEVWQSWDMLGLLKNFGFCLKRPQTPTKDLDKLLKKALTLTAREKECLKLLLLGNTSKDSAKKLYLSFRTVEYYFENIKDKLSCSCKKELHYLARILDLHNLL